MTVIYIGRRDASVNGPAADISAISAIYCCAPYTRSSALKCLHRAQNIGVITNPRIACSATQFPGLNRRYSIFCADFKRSSLLFQFNP